LTDVLELYIIELPKVNKYQQVTKNTTLNTWVKFIESPEVLEMKDNNKEIQKAKKILEEISQDEHEIYLAELREKYIMDQNDIEAAGYDKGLKQGLEQGIKQGLEQGLEQGIEQGLEQGIEQGLEQGQKQMQYLIVKKLKSKKMSLKDISEITGLSVEEINKI